MSKEQALKLLVDLTAQLKLTREEHALVIQALEVLKK